MPLAFSNKVTANQGLALGGTANSTPAFGAALQKKISPPVLSPLSFNSTPAQATGGVKPPAQTGGTTAIAPNTDSSVIQKPITQQQVQQPLQNSQPLQQQQNQSVPPVQQQQNQPPTYQGIISQLINTPRENPGVQYLQEAGKVAGEAGKLRQQIAQGKQAIMGDPNYSGSVKIGQAGLIDQNLGTQLTGLSNQQDALTHQGNAYITGQQQQITALQSAGQLAQPQMGEYGKTYYNPLQAGQPQGGSQGIQPNDPFYKTLQTYAGLLANNQGGTIPATITGNSVLNAQLQQMAKEINPAYNYNVAQGVGAAQASNAQTAGTAGVQANQAVFNDAYKAYTQLQNATQNVDQFGSLLTSGMQDAQGNTINPFDVKYANQKLADIRNQLSNAQQAQFDTTLAALKSKVSGLLSVGGNEIPTAITADAQKILDGSLPFGSLNSVLQRIQTEGNILLQNQANLVNSSYAGTQGQNNANAGSNNQHQNAGSNSIYSF